MLLQILQAAGFAEDAFWITERLQLTGAQSPSTTLCADTSMFPDKKSLRVEAQFSNGEWYPATITSQSSEKVSVLFDDGYVLDDLPPDAVRELSSEVC